MECAGILKNVKCLHLSSQTTLVPYLNGLATVQLRRCKHEHCIVVSGNLVIGLQ